LVEDNMVEAVKIKTMRKLVTPYPVFVFKDTPADEIADVFICNPKLRSVYVVDENLKLIGKVTLSTLIKNEFQDLIPESLDYFESLQFIGEKTAEELMIPPVYVKDDDTLKTAFLEMYKHNLEELPVVDDERHLVGNIDLIELLTILIEKKEKNKGKKYLSLHINRPFTR